MSLKGIIAISGKPGLYKIIAQSKNGFIVESLMDNKRAPISSTQRVSALSDISVYTTGEEMPLREIFKTMEAANTSVDAKKTDIATLKNEFRKVLPTFDESRVYNSDIQKVFNWFNSLKGQVSFEEENEENETVEVPAEALTEEKPKKKAAAPKAEKAETEEAPKKKAASKKKADDEATAEAPKKKAAPKKKKED